MNPLRLGFKKLVLLVVVMVGATTVIVMTRSAMSEPETDAYAVFEDASPLIEGNDVKLGGVKVGTITSIEVENGKAKVGLALDDDVLPLHKDAAARVRPLGLLGERYVELDRGSPDAATMKEGGEIAVARTSRATDLDEVLNTVDDPTATALAALVTTLGEGIEGNGGDIDAAVKALAPALGDVDQLSTILNGQTDVLNQLVDSLEPVAQALATGDGKKLDTLVDSADKLLGATASQEKNLDSTLKELPSSLVEARATLRSLSKVAGATTPNLKSLRPTTSRLSTLSKELTAFSKATDPALEGLDPVLSQAKALIADARPLAQSLRSQSGNMRTSVHQARPVVNRLLGNFRNVLDFIKYWALTTNGDDALSHYFRAHLVVTDEIVTGLVPTTGNLDSPKLDDPETEEKNNSLLPGLLSNGNGSKDGSTSKAPLEDLLSGLGLGKKTSTTNPSAAKQRSATGLSSKQESNLISYLIGGSRR
ncbi:hypothetical protein ASG90_06915 [Nocardioides sp. Soil797]|nr:hypothetical protein ASG90_06915 [Nocardioides sp. Soil797]